MNITHDMNKHYCQLCRYESLGRCFGDRYGEDVSVDNEPCDGYIFAGTEERLKEIELAGNNIKLKDDNYQSNKMTRITVSKRTVDEQMKVKPCPFCGSTKIDFEEDTYNGLCCVKCFSCCATGGTIHNSTNTVRENRIKAIEYWNQRV